MEGNIDVDVVNLGELVRRLKDKRDAVSKELSELGTPPQELSELLRLCQGFERAFSSSINSLETAFYIKEAFLGDSGLQGTLRKLPVEKKFRLDVIKAIVREADGYQPHLVSPEKGLRRLVEECLSMARDPVQTCVERVYQLMVAAARDASGKAFTTLNAMEALDMKSKRMPAFERTVTTAAQSALDEWKKDAVMVATALVDMEGDYITSAFFRRAVNQRAAMFEEGMMMEDSGGVDKNSENEEEGDEDEDDDDDDDDVTTDDDSEDEKPKKKAPAKRAPQGEFDPNQLKSGYLEKRIGEHSTRGSVPLESWKWQKRWFIFTETKGMLYYFKTPDDPPNYRGAVNIRECVVEDLDAQGYPKAAAKSKYELDGNSGSVSLLIRISHKDPNKSVIKKHHSLVLRAPTAAEKFEWLSRLRHASDPGGPGTRRLIQAQSKRLMSAQQSKKGSGSTTGGGGGGGEDDETDYYKYSSLGAKPLTSIGGNQQFNIGIGTAIPFHEGSKTLAPIPPWRYVITDGDGDRYEAYLEQLGQDCNEYTRVVLDTIQTEVPKSVVHCLVKKGKEDMLQKLYDTITRMQPWEVSAVLEEDSSTVQRRAATSNAVRDIDKAIAESEKVLTSNASKGGKASVPRAWVDMADMWDMVERPKSAEPRDKYGEYTPSALRKTNSGGRRPSVSVPNGGSPASSSPKEPSPSSTTSPATTRPPTPPGAAPPAAAAAAAAAQGPPQPAAPGGPSPRPRRRPPPAPPAAGPAS